MRIFAFLLFCLSIAAYKSLKTNSPQAPALAAGPKGQAAKILFQSTDGGKTWQDFSRGLPETLQINSVLAQDGEVFLGAENGGLYHSSNPAMGLWEQENVEEMLPNAGGVSSIKKITGIFPGRSGPYVCVSQGGFFRKIPGTNIWQSMNEAIKYEMVHSVLETPGGIIFAACNSGIYKSEDDGKTWKHVFGKGWVTSLVAAGDAIVATGYPGLLRSTDGGEHWDCVLTDESGAYRTSAIEGRFVAVPAGGSWHTYADGRSVLASADGGKTWQRMAEGLSPWNIYDFKQAGEYLFYSHDGGISRSADGGKTWELVCPFAATDKNTSLRLAVSGQTVFAVMVRAGC